MKNWSTIKLGDCTEIARGSSPRPINDSAYFDKGKIPWIKIADATASFKYIYETKEYVNDYGASFSRKLPPGSLIVAASGTLGFAIFLGVEGCIHDGWMYFKSIDERRFDKQFLYYLLNTLTKSFNAFSYGAAIQNINTEILRNTSFRTPPLTVQSSIAAILSAYDELIENNQRRIALLEKMAEEIYREWFVRLRFPGHKTTQFVKGVPDGWQSKKLGELVRTQYGYTASAETEVEGPQFLRITDIVPAAIDWALVPHCKIEGKDEEKYLLQVGDIVVARTGATVGYAKRINKYVPKAVFASYLVRLVPTRKSDAIYLGLSVERSAFKDFIWMYVTGAAQPQANATTMALFPLFYPSEFVLKEFNRIIEPMLDEKELLLNQTVILLRTRNLLLPRLISGKLSVENLDVQFPPSMGEPTHET